MSCWKKKKQKTVTKKKIKERAGTWKGIVQACQQQRHFKVRRNNTRWQTVEQRESKPWDQKKVSYALSLCQEKGHTGNPIVSKSFLVEAQMQCLGTETRRNRMREGCRSHYAARWCSQEKETEKWQEESSHGLCLGRSMKIEGMAAPILNPITIATFLLFCFFKGWDSTTTLLHDGPHFSCILFQSYNFSW